MPRRLYAWMTLLLTVGVLSACSVAGLGATPTATPVPTPTPISVAPPTFAISAIGVYLIDADTGQVYYQKNGDQRRAIASTTKIMTALVALNSGKLDQMVTVTSDITAIDDTMLSVMCCPRVKVGEQYSIKELLYGLLIPSGGDAAIMIADALAGSEDAYVEQMNEEATKLGLQDTQYVNVHGLDVPGGREYSTAHDLAVMTRVAMQNPIFADIVKRSTYTLPATSSHQLITLDNTNDLLASAADLGIDGVKTGSTLAAGQCIVLDARHKGYHLILVVLGEQNADDRTADSEALFQWIFDQLPAKGAPTPGTTPTAGQ